MADRLSVTTSVPKSAVSARLATVERQGNHWLEPLTQFVSRAHQAHLAAVGENLDLLKEWTIRIGSNPP
jgi:hypothetical protein